MSTRRPAFSIARSRPTGWLLFVLLLVAALATEYWDKNPLTLPGGIDVPWARFVLAMAVAPLAITANAWRWSALARVPGEMRPLLVFYAACALSVVGLLLNPLAPDGLLQYFKTLAHLSLYALLVYVIVKRVTWERLQTLVRAYYLFGVAAALLALAQFVSGTFGLLPWMSAFYFRSAEYEVGGGIFMGFRASSIFGEPSWAARYYIHWIALSCAYWWFTRQQRYLWALALFGLAFYVANSLLGYVLLATFAGVLVLSFMWQRNMLSLSPAKKLVVAALGLAIVFGWLVGVRLPLPRLLESTIARVALVVQGGGGSGNRWDSIYAGLEVWRRAPIFGVGLGNIEGHIVKFYRDKAYVFRSYFGSDSLYVQLLAETGLVGFLAFLYFWGRLILGPAALRFDWTHLPPDAAQASAWLRLLQIDAVAQGVGMLNYSDYLSPHLWTVVGIALACRALLVREGASTAFERAGRATRRLDPAPA